MKKMEYTNINNIDEYWNIIDFWLIKSIKTKTDNKEKEKSLIWKDEVIVWFWEAKTIQEELKDIMQKAEHRIKEEVYLRKNRNWIKEYYSDWEIKTWNTKVELSKLVLWGWESELLSSYTPTGLTVKKYAKKILKKAKTKSILVAEIEKEKNDAINNLFNN